jgi:hypothetical protein
MFIVGIVNRASSTYDLFFKLSSEFGFTCRKVETSEYLQGVDASPVRNWWPFDGNIKSSEDRSVFPRVAPKEQDDTRELDRRRPTLRILCLQLVDWVNLTSVTASFTSALPKRYFVRSRR